MLLGQRSRQVLSCLLLILLYPGIARSGLIAITDSRSDLGGNDYIDLAPLGALGSPLEPYFDSAGRLLPTSTQIEFSLTSAHGLRADFFISILSDVSAGTLVPNRSALQVVSPSASFLDGEPYTGLQVATRGPQPSLDVRIAFEESVYGVGTNVFLAGLQARGAFALDEDGDTITGARVTGTLDNPLAVDRFVGFVTAAPEIHTFRLVAGGQSFGDGNPFIHFNRIDLLTIAPAAAAPFGPGFSSGSGPQPVPEPSTLCLVGIAIASQLIRVGSRRLRSCHWARYTGHVEAR